MILKVSDNGIGISKEAAGKLFNSFSQADSSITRLYGGTGLGLSICNKLAALMGGNIEFESQLDQGTTFVCTFPLPRATFEQTKEFTSTSVSFLDSGVDFAAQYPHKILVAEDNSINQMVIKRMLSKLGYTCDVVSNGQKAIEELKDHTIIFMDIQMPILDGISASRMIVEKLGRSAPSIVAVSANVFKEDRERCIEAGMVDHIPKPFNLDHLRAVLIKYCT